MNRIDRSRTGIATLGRDEDQFMAHVALGERIVPPVITPETQARIDAEMQAAGLNPYEYKVGDGMSINPITGLPEFGFLSKTWKSVKKVVKKVAPVAAVIPGPWQPYAAIYMKGSSALKIAKGEGGIGDIMTLASGGNQKLFGADGAFQKIGGTAATNSPGFFESIKKIGSVKNAAGDSVFNPLKYGANVLRSKASDLNQGLGGLFGGGTGGRFDVDTIFDSPAYDGLTEDQKIKLKEGINTPISSTWNQTYAPFADGGYLEKYDDGGYANMSTYEKLKAIADSHYG